MEPAGDLCRASSCPFLLHWRWKSEACCYSFREQVNALPGASPFSPQPQISRYISSSSRSSLAFCLPFPLIPADCMISADLRRVQLGATTHSCSICYRMMSSSSLVPKRRGSTWGMTGSQPPAGRWEGRESSISHGVGGLAVAGRRGVRQG